jgi:hypothetical protein
MNHYKLTFNYKDGSNTTVWVVDGRYKIVCYDYRTSGSYTEKRKTYHTYYRPSHFKNWGNHVDSGTPNYDTLEQALQAADRFDAESGHLALVGGSLN